ncbi:MAG: tetratricopeptide repeat protein [Methyloligellaceae bacterium]
MRVLVLSFFIIYSFLLGFASSANASNAAYWKNCSGTKPKVSACTKIINSGRETKQNLAKAYNNRGVAYHDQSLFDSAIGDYSRAITNNPNYALAYSNRGLAYARKLQYSLAIKDYNEALRLKPGDAGTYDNRGLAYSYQGNYKKAIQDHNQSIRIKRNDPISYNNRGFAFHQKGDYDRAIADYTQAIRFNRNYALAYDNRGLAHARKKQFALAIADHTEAIRIQPDKASYYSNRATSYRNAREHDLAIADYDKAIRLDPNLINAYTNRGFTYELKKEYDTARRDYYSVLALPDLQASRSAKDYAKRAIKRIEGKKNSSPVVIAKNPDRPVIPLEQTNNKPSTFKLGRRLALVIGNSKYSHASSLKNPANDARAVADALKRLGFVQVIEKYNLDYNGLRTTLKDFGDAAVNSDWALIYYAGHGIQVGGTNYVIPIDAKLAHAAHVEEEAISLDRVLSKVSEARRLRMVILDACRDNPFSKKMKTNGSRSRSLGRGLANVEPERGTLVAFAARDGQVADDGDGKHSPYTRALLEHLEKNKLEVSLLFRKVRDTVLKRTGRRQEPYVYGSLPGDELYFKK